MKDYWAPLPGWAWRQPTRPSCLRRWAGGRKSRTKHGERQSPLV